MKFSNDKEILLRKVAKVLDDSFWKAIEEYGNKRFKAGQKAQDEVEDLLKESQKLLFCVNHSEQHSMYCEECLATACEEVRDNEVQKARADERQKTLDEVEKILINIRQDLDANDTVRFPLWCRFVDEFSALLGVK